MIRHRHLILLLIILLGVTALNYFAVRVEMDKRLGTIIANQNNIKELLTTIAVDVEASKSYVASNVQTMNSLNATLNEHNKNFNKYCLEIATSAQNKEVKKREYNSLLKKVDRLTESVEDKNKHIEQMDARLQAITDYIIKGWQVPKK